MATAERPQDPKTTAACFASVLDAEAQAHDAIRHCRKQHDEIIRQAQTQAGRIRQRADGRMEKVQAAAAARVKALLEAGVASAPPAGKRFATVQDAQLQAAVGRLAAQLTGGDE